MSGVNSTVIPFLTREYEGCGVEEAWNVTFAAIAADNSTGSPRMGDHADARLPLGPNEALHARSMADELSEKIGEPSIDAQDQLGTCPVEALVRRHRVLSLGYQRRASVLKVHCPAMYPDCRVGESAFAMLAIAMRRSLSYVIFRAVYSVMM